MQDYRLTYLTKNIKEEAFKIVDVGVNFVLEGDKGTRLEMKPIIPNKIIVDQGDSVMIVTRTSMTVKGKKQPKVEQLDMGLVPNE